MTKESQSILSCFIHEEFGIIIENSVSPAYLLFGFPFSSSNLFNLVLLSGQMLAERRHYFFKRFRKSSLDNSSLVLVGFFSRKFYFSDSNEEDFFGHKYIN